MSSIYKKIVVFYSRSITIDRNFLSGFYVGSIVVEPTLFFFFSKLTKKLLCIKKAQIFKNQLYVNAPEIFGFETFSF